MVPCRNDRSNPVAWRAAIAALLGAGLAAHGAFGASNPYYAIDPGGIFPSPASILPGGTAYTDTVPATLDPAEQAKLFIAGATREEVPLGDLWIPGGPAYFSAQNPGRDKCEGNPPPCLDSVEGYQNWGKLALGLFLAREMSGYDRDDRQGTLAAQYRSLTTMLSWDTFLALRDRAAERHLGGYNLVVGQRFATPASVVMQALTARYREDPGNGALKAAIDEYVRMHQKLLKPQTIGGRTCYGFLDPATDRLPPGRWDTFGGYNGEYFSFAFVHGRAAMAMFEWYALTGNPDALEVGAKLADFLRNFAPLWADPDPARFPPAGPGQFAGHIHSYLQAAHAFTDEAALRLKAGPQDALAREDIRLARDMYEFVKRRTRGEALGNFGEMDGVDDMIRLGIDLSELGAGPYWEEVERWTRNTLADRQIDPATARQYIGNAATGRHATDHVGDKVTGMWFSDATHSLAVPEKAWMFNIDDATNPMHALYEVWRHTIDLDGGLARVNFDLNRAGQYFDVKSDLPYRGQIEIAMKADIDPVAAVAVRIPGWARRDKLSVAVRDGSGERALAPRADWDWLPGPYVRIPHVAPGVAYRVRFPIEVYQRSFSDIRAADEFWYEGDYPSPGRNAAERIVTFTGVFRGDTLVDALPRPSGGVARYQRQALAQLPPRDAAPPYITVQRFVFAGAGRSADPP